MHLYKATAMLMGFPSPVANVHFLAARTEATIDTTVGESVGGEEVGVFAEEASPQGRVTKHRGPELRRRL